MNSEIPDFSLSNVNLFNASVFSVELFNVDRLGWALLHSVWVFGLMGILLWCCLRVMRGRSANSRYVVSIIAMALLPAILVATFCLVPMSDIDPATVSTANASLDEFEPVQHGDSTQPVPMPLESWKSESRSPSTTVSNGTSTGSINPRSETPARQRSFSQSVKTCLPMIVIGWLIGMLVSSLRPLVGWLTIGRLRRSMTIPKSVELTKMLPALAARTGLRRQVGLFQSSLISVPMAIGFLRPIILIPASAISGLTLDQSRALLVHELAHIHRHDYVFNLIQTVIETLLFYHPLVWWISRKIRDERENCCDDIAVRVSGDRATYAQALLSMDGLRGTHASFTTKELSMSARGGSLLRRVRRMAGIEPNGNLVSNFCAATFVGLATTGLTITVFCSLVNPSLVAEADSSVTNTLLDSPSRQGEDDGWGNESGGLRIRAFPVLASMSEDKIDPNSTQDEFVSHEEFAVAIEMENVSDSTIRFLDTRYGKGYGASKGKANSNLMSKFLFSFEYFDANDQLIDAPVVTFIDSVLSLSGTLVEELKTGDLITSTI